MWFLETRWGWNCLNLPIWRVRKETGGACTLEVVCLFKNHSHVQFKQNCPVSVLLRNELLLSRNGFHLCTVPLRPQFSPEVLGKNFSKNRKTNCFLVWGVNLFCLLKGSLIALFWLYSLFLFCFVRSFFWAFFLQVVAELEGLSVDCVYACERLWAPVWFGSNAFLGLVSPCLIIHSFYP